MPSSARRLLARTTDTSFTAADASSLEKHAVMVFTPNMFELVRWSIDAVSKCFISGDTRWRRFDCVRGDCVCCQQMLYLWSVGVFIVTWT
jgi:hypothetical protein